MTKDQRRKAIMLGAAGVLAVVVVLDRAGLFSSGGDETGADARQAYLAQASLVERTRQVVDQEDAWRDLLAGSRSSWEGVRPSLIHGASAELAAGRLRDMVEAILRDLDLRIDSSRTLPVRTPLEGEPVRIIGLTLDVHAPNPDVLYRALDRLENIEDAITNIDRLSVQGPGLRGAPGVRVSLDLRAMAWIGQEG
ncbi:MAG: hypothetical protein EA376_08590 [Phycisphaeraceae bacterium]|nr:MAG: hypothetical protein EA376_08590 [Phycisphaeraceae bacterium]